MTDMVSIELERQQKNNTIVKISNKNAQAFENVFKPAVQNYQNHASQMFSFSPDAKRSTIWIKSHLGDSSSAQKTRSGMMDLL